MSRSSIELLRATAQGHQDCAELVELVAQVDQLESWLELQEDDEDQSEEQLAQINTIIDYLVYRAIHLHGISDLKEIQAIERGFANLQAKQFSGKERDAVAGFLFESIRISLQTED